MWRKWIYSRLGCVVGCGDQEKHNKMVMTYDRKFSSFGTTYKEGTYIPRSPQLKKWVCKRERPCTVNITVQPLHKV